MDLKNNIHHYKKGGKQKAIDHLAWLNFSYRTKIDGFKLLETPRGALMVAHNSFYQADGSLPRIRTFRRSYKRMKYSHIGNIAKDKEPLEHWEAIRGMLSTQDGELLRFIVKFQIPLKKFIRYELASRGFDKDHKWCGFEKAAAIWLNK